MNRTRCLSFEPRRGFNKTETRLHPTFNPEEIKIEHMLSDKAIGDVFLGSFRPCSSQAPKRRVLGDEVVDGVLLRAFGSNSSSQATKRRAPKMVSKGQNGKSWFRTLLARRLY